ncbi:MAG: peptidoglycan-binding domain-containing protein [bacterium]
MRVGKRAMLAGLLAATLTLSACGTIDESYLVTEANYSVDISVPYATTTPLPEYLNVPDAIVIDQDGNVTLNDASVIEGDFTSARDEEQQSEYRSLALGATGIAVQALQSRLQALGYYTGEISGVYDIPTETAVKHFEQTYSTMQTGVATQKLQLRLFNASAPTYGSAAYNEAVVSQYAILRPGTVGSSVYALQQRLKNLGYPITDLSGVYDQQTALCVRLFYSAYGVASSEVADVNMQRRLYAEDAREYDPSLSVQPTEAPVRAVEGDAMVPEGDMETGSVGENVRRIQERLVDLGYLDRGGDTGEFDEATLDAVDRFLRAVGREPDGTLSEEMQLFLMSASAPAAKSGEAAVEYTNLNPGDSGEAVMNLQRRLVELGYANGNPNGKYGNATISAVQLYQALNGLEVDGLASAWLQSMLFSDSARTYREVQGIQQATATPEPTVAADTLYFNLSIGSTGNAVQRLQERLHSLGYNVDASGEYDRQTGEAVAAFQTAICVPATGEASASLQRYVYSKAAPGPDVRFYSVPQTFSELALGASGDKVTRLQQQLFSLNLLRRQDVQDSIGAFNEATRQAVITAQRAMGYDNPDGVASVEFQSFLFSKYSRNIKQ